MLGYVCALLILLEGVGIVWNLRAQRSAQAANDHSRILRRTMTQTLLALVDMETGERGFTLTGDDSYLQPFVSGQLRLEESIVSLEQLTADNEMQHTNVTSIAGLAVAKSNELRAAIAVRRKGGDSIAFIRTDRGKLLMDQIRQMSADFLTDEGETFEASQNRFHHLSDVMMGVSCVGTLFAFGLASASTLWTRQAVADTYAANAEAEARANELRVKADSLKEQEAIQAQQLRDQQKLSFELTEVNFALAQSNHDLEQFSYVASHDLKAPLRGISNLSNWIEDDLGTAVTEEARQQFALLRGRVRRLEELINGIAQYSRAGREDSELENVDVEALLNEIRDLAAPTADVKIYIENPMPTVWTNKTLLQQVFSNLISNAMKHATPEKGCITIRSSEESEGWRFSVTDNGPGIAPAFHARIFELFQTLHSKDRREGSGIGLALVKKLVERYGGEVRVDSELGAGACFSFTWPKVFRARQGAKEISA